MTNSSGQRAHQIIADLRAATDSERLTALIDQPIERAIARFRFRPCRRWSIRRIHRQLGQFVLHLAHSGIGPVPPSVDRAAEEAIALLERNFQGPARGYAGAIDSITANGEEGMNNVLIALAGLIQTRQRAEYLAWAVSRRLAQLDWPARCQVAACLLVELRELLGDVLGGATPESLADHLLALLQTSNTSVVGSASIPPAQP